MIRTLLMSTALLITCTNASAQLPGLWKYEVVARVTPSTGTPFPSGFPVNRNLGSQCPSIAADGTVAVPVFAPNSFGNPSSWQLIVAPPGKAATISSTVATVSTNTSFSEPIECNAGRIAFSATIAPIGGGTPSSRIRVLNTDFSHDFDVIAGGPLGVDGSFIRPRLLSSTVIAYTAFIDDERSYIIDDFTGTRSQTLVADTTAEYSVLATLPGINRGGSFAGRATITGSPLAYSIELFPAGQSPDSLISSTVSSDIEVVSAISSMDEVLFVYRSRTGSPPVVGPFELRLSSQGVGALIASEGSGNRGSFTNLDGLGEFGSAAVTANGVVAFVGVRSGNLAVYVASGDNDPVRLIGDGDSILTNEGTLSIGVGTSPRFSIGRLDVSDSDNLCDIKIAFTATLEDSSDVLVVATPCRADFNNDGLVTPDDLDEYITAYFEENPEVQTVDTNCDGIVSPDDLDDFITLYYDGC